MQITNRKCKSQIENEMTCKDCKYFNKDIHPKDEYIGYGYCERRVADGYREYPAPDCEICDMFEDKDGTYHDGTEHCPKCGKAVDKWGLCNECDSWESISK